MDLNYMIQSNVQLWDFVRKVRNIWIPYKAGNFWLFWQVLASQYLFAHGKFSRNWNLFFFIEETLRVTQYTIQARLFNIVQGSE